MVDISVTAANVVKGTGAVTQNGTAGATITAGQSIYLDTVAGTLKLADADVVASAAAAGIALHGASLNQPLAYQSAGRITIGGTVVVGTVYVVSITAGGVAPLADIASGDFVTVLGIGVTTAIIALDIQVSGVAI